MEEKPKPGIMVNMPMPMLYFNGFALSVTPADVNVKILQDGQQVAILRMSFTTAKTFAIKLSEGMTYLDSKLEQPIYTIDQMNVKLKPEGGSSDKSSHQ